MNGQELEEDNRRKEAAINYACVEGHENWKSLYREQYPNFPTRVKHQVKSDSGKIKWINEKDLASFSNEEYRPTGVKIDMLACTYDELPEEYKKLSVVTATAAYNSLQENPSLVVAGKVVHDAWFEYEGKFYSKYVKWEDMSEIEKEKDIQIARLVQHSLNST